MVYHMYLCRYLLITSADHFSAKKSIPVAPPAVVVVCDRDRGVHQLVVPFVSRCSLSFNKNQGNLSTSLDTYRVTPSRNEAHWLMVSSEGCSRQPNRKNKAVEVKRLLQTEDTDIVVEVWLVIILVNEVGDYRADLFNI